MLFRFFVLLGVICAVFSKVLVKSYRNGEMITPQNQQANVEYHCFDLDSKGHPKYVRGTYGNRGYFEGAVRDGMAAVNFYEATPTNTFLRPTTGAAVLTYTKNWSKVKGPFWNGGGSNITTPQDWGITGECKSCLKGKSINAIIKDKCLWDRSATTGREVPHDVNNVVFGDNTFSLSTFRNAVVGPVDTDGTTVGGYWYQYTDEQCAQLNIDCQRDGHVEYGNYGLNAVSASVTQAKIFVSSWQAVTGPLAGNFGSGVYTMTKSAVTDQLTLNGIICYAHYVEIDPAAGLQIALGDCSSDGGQQTSSMDVGSLLHSNSYSGQFGLLNEFVQQIQNTNTN